MGKKKRVPEIELPHIHEQLRSLAVPITDLNLDPANARTHPERNIQAIIGSLKLYGQRKPIVVRKEDMTIEAGNGTLEAARALGWTHIAAVVVDDDQMAAAGFAIADNRTGELAEWDFSVLAKTMESLKAIDFDLNDIGWADYEVEPLLEADWNPPAIDDEADPGSGGMGDANKSKDFSIILDEAQRERVNKAIAKLRKEYPRLAEGEAVASICDEWLSK